MATSVGSIEYDSRINTSQLKRDSAEAESIARNTGKTMGDEAEKGESRASAAFGKLANAAKIAAIAGGAVLATGIAAAAKAAFSQVDAVQQATIALTAYEKDGNKVNQVLKDLVSYARSDLGVLFNRKDLFQSAQSLKLYGDNTEALTGHVKILSRSVGLGLSTWEGLNNVIGRVGSTGRLYADDLQYLQNAGFKLDSSLSGSTQTFESLFNLLDAGIPADALNNQADTIQGRFIKLQTAFRDVGNSILGVDRDTNKFIQGGLGDRFVNGITSATLLLKSLGETLKPIATNIINVARQVGDYLSPKLTALWNTIKAAMPTFRQFTEEILKPLAKVLGAELVFGIGLGIDALNGLAHAIEWVMNRAIDVKNFFTDTLPQALSAAWDIIKQKATEVKDHFFEKVGEILGFFATLPIMMPIYVAEAIAKVVSLIASVKWSDVFSGIWQGMQAVWDKITRIVNDAWHKIHDIEWGKLFTGIGKSFANGLIDLIEGALRGALKGLPGNVEKKINLPRFASGTNFAPGGASIVGERGPEIVNLPRGAQVIPNHDLDSFAQGSSNNNINISLNMSGIMARSTADLRDVGKDILRAINQELTAKGQPAIGGIT